MAWGHSILVEPWGTVLSQMNEKEGIRLSILDLNKEKRMREELPFFMQRRTDLYELKKL